MSCVLQLFNHFNYSTEDSKAPTVNPPGGLIGGPV